MSKQEEPKTPSIFQMAKNFSKELAKYIKEGAPNVSNSVYIERLEACNTCPHLIKKQMRCGCMLEHKAKWKTTTCPDKPERWKPVFMDKATLELKKNFDEEQEKEERIKNVKRKKELAENQKRINAHLKRGNLTLKEMSNPIKMKKIYGQLKSNGANKKNNNTKTGK